MWSLASTLPATACHYQLPPANSTTQPPAAIVTHAPCCLTPCRFHKAVFRMEKGLPPNKLVPALRAEVDMSRALGPVLGALRNDKLRERHWARVCEVLGQQLARDASLTVQVGQLAALRLLLLAPLC